MTETTCPHSAQDWYINTATGRTECNECDKAATSPTPPAQPAPRRFRKKPVVIEAIQYHPHENCQEIAALIGVEWRTTSAPSSSSLTSAPDRARGGN